MNDQDLPKTATNSINAPLATDVLAPRAADLHESVGGKGPVELDLVGVNDDERLEEEFADDDDAVGEFDDGDEDSDDEGIIAAQMKNKLEQFFADDPLIEEINALDVLTLEEAAIYLKVGYGDIRRMVKEQGLPGRKIGEEWRFLRGAIADWLRAPGGSPTPAAQTEKPARSERPAREDRPQRDDHPRRRFPEEESESNEGYPQRSQPPRPRPQFRSQNQIGGGAEAGGHQGGSRQGGQGQGGMNVGGAGQGGYPPPRRRRYENDQQQQPPQGEFRPPRKRPPVENAGSREGGGQFGGGQGTGGPVGGRRFVGGPKKPKRDALENQRFKRLDRRRFGSDQAE